MTRLIRWLERRHARKTATYNTRRSGAITTKRTQ